MVDVICASVGDVHIVLQFWIDEDSSRMTFEVTAFLLFGCFDREQYSNRILPVPCGQRIFPVIERSTWQWFARSLGKVASIKVSHLPPPNSSRRFSECRKRTVIRVESILNCASTLSTQGTCCHERSSIGVECSSPRTGGSGTGWSGKRRACNRFLDALNLLLRDKRIGAHRLLALRRELREVPIDASALEDSGF